MFGKIFQGKKSKKVDPTLEELDRKTQEAVEFANDIVELMNSREVEARVAVLAIRMLDQQYSNVEPGLYRACNLILSMGEIVAHKTRPAPVYPQAEA